MSPFMIILALSKHNEALFFGKLNNYLNNPKQIRQNIYKHKFVKMRNCKFNLSRK